MWSGHTVVVIVGERARKDGVTVCVCRSGGKQGVRFMIYRQRERGG